MNKPLDLTDQTWAFALIVIGCLMVLVCKHYAINENVGAGIVGAGTMAFTNSVRHDVPATTNLEKKEEH